MNIPEKETMDNLLAHEQTCRRISSEKGCLYPPEAESLYWLIDSLRAQLAEAKRDGERLEKSANFHRDMGITTLDAKYLDTACWKGCQSLVWQGKLSALRNALQDLMVRCKLTEREQFYQRVQVEWEAANDALNEIK